MVRLSPELSKIVRIVPSKKMLTGLVCYVECRTIIVEAGTAQGLSPRLAILDEVGQVRGPTDAFVEAIETSLGAHDDQLLISISTQAATDGDLFSIWLDDASSDGLRDKARSEKVPWDIWAEQGYLQTIDCTVIQPEVIENVVAEVAEEYDLRLMA